MHIEETFDIKRANTATGHGGRDRMVKELVIRKYPRNTLVIWPNDWRSFSVIWPNDWRLEAFGQMSGLTH